MLKELIQNAEDAKATRLDLLLIPGDPALDHPLLHGPGLLVANDGKFWPEERDAITQINLGTKGTAERAIGRFGKGLKSVFAWCEAFFFVARTDPALGWANSEQPIADLFSPWDDWRHQDWGTEFARQPGTVRAKVQDCLPELYRDTHAWLAFWFPLRHQAHGRDEQGPVEWIYSGHATLPGADPRFGAQLQQALRELSPSLVMVRHLRRISIVDRVAAGQPTLTWEFSGASKRIPPPDDPPGVGQVSGETLVREPSGEVRRLCYSGVAGRLPGRKYADMRDDQHWPLVARSRRDHVGPDSRAKGEPHFAALVSAQAVPRGTDSGSLEIRWCVFFPVGKQPSDARVLLHSLGLDVTINLHGFFFLDSMRLRVDGLEDQFRTDSTSVFNVYVEWNRALAEEGALAHLPEALSTFAQARALTSAQCDELARALRQDWLWVRFQAAVCAAFTWRPRWRGDTQVWECIPSAQPVYEIPDGSDSPGLLARIPGLAVLSEQEVLVVPDSEGMLSGLYFNAPAVWPEKGVLQLLEGAQLGRPPDDSIADWLNRFLDYLHGQQALTPEVRERVADLPLVLARDARTGNRARHDARRIQEQAECGLLFGADSQTSHWLGLILKALPNWTCLVTDEGTLPKWYNGPRSVSCDESRSAQIILGEPVLAMLPDRLGLARDLGTYVHRNQAIVLALRFLMHGDAAQRQDSGTLLFLPPNQPGQQIWSRLVQQLLQKGGGGSSWRLLDRQWSEVLAPQLQQELGIVPIDAEGAWLELMSRQVGWSSLTFDTASWTTSDLSTLVQGLYNAGSGRPDDTLALLRSLPIHTLLAQSEYRVSVADSRGALDAAFVLDNPGFAAALPPNLHPLWQAFLAATKVIERLPSGDLASRVQNSLFERADGAGTTYAAELDWNCVVRRCLEASDPSAHAPLILEALGTQGDQAARSLGQTIKRAKWLPLALGGSIAPESILAISGLEEELDHLLDPARDGLAGERALPEWVRIHRGFSTLRNYLPRLDEALEMLALWLGDSSEWYLGLQEEFVPQDRDGFLMSLAALGLLPGAGLLAKLARVTHQGQIGGLKALLATTVWPALLKPFPEVTTEAAKIEHVLRRLQENGARDAFDAYLCQACSDQIAERLLPRLSLRNQRGQWVPATQLIWPSHNLDPATQLCDGQAAILRVLRPDHGGADPATDEVYVDARSSNQLGDPPDFGAATAQLREYLKPFRNGNIGDNLPAALVAVLGGHTAVHELLETLLQSAMRQNADDFRAWLLGEQHSCLAPHMARARFLIEVIRGHKVSARTITGDLIEAELTADVHSLIVGDPGDLYWRLRYSNRPETECHGLKLRWIDKPDDLQNPVAVFASTIQAILLEVYCNGVADLVPRNIEDALAQIADAGQADLRRSQSYLLDMAEARLKELGIRESPELDKVMRKFSEARQARVDADTLSERAPIRAKERNDEAVGLDREAKKQLLGLLETEDGEQSRLALVAAVCRKMTDFQYDVTSVPYELFQNADDAAAELAEIRGLRAEEGRFVLQYLPSHQELTVIYWGRPINRHAYPGLADGQRRGYDQDLQKMLTLNFSDKGVGDGGHQAIVTGRFGLGFKSVFFCGR
jgi:hypothetical protein